MKKRRYIEKTADTVPAAGVTDQLGCYIHSMVHSIGWEGCSQ